MFLFVQKGDIWKQLKRPSFISCLNTFEGNTRNAILDLRRTGAYKKKFPILCRIYENEAILSLLQLRGVEKKFLKLTVGVPFSKASRTEGYSSEYSRPGVHLHMKSGFLCFMTTCLSLRLLNFTVFLHLNSVSTAIQFSRSFRRVNIYLQPLQYNIYYNNLNQDVCPLWFCNVYNNCLSSEFRRSMPYNFPLHSLYIM